MQYLKASFQNPLLTMSDLLIMAMNKCCVIYLFIYLFIIKFDKLCQAKNEIHEIYFKASHAHIVVVLKDNVK